MVRNRDNIADASVRDKEVQKRCDSDTEKLRVTEATA